jgi:hypothetical protein
MDPRTLCALHQCRIVHFMFHDRVSFGGTLLAIGVLYLWLLAFPLRQGREWAWYTLLLSGTVGFLSFLAYRTLALWQALLVAGITGFGCAIGIHYPMGYLTFSHLLPAYLGAGLYALGIVGLGAPLKTNQRNP